jgi:hypothetical protein
MSHPSGVFPTPFPKTASKSQPANHLPSQCKNPFRAMISPFFALCQSGSTTPINPWPPNALLNSGLGEDELRDLRDHGRTGRPFRVSGGVGVMTPLGEIPAALFAGRRSFRSPGGSATSAPRPLPKPTPGLCGLPDTCGATGLRQRAEKRPTTLLAERTFWRCFRVLPAANSRHQKEAAEEGPPAAVPPAHVQVPGMLPLRIYSAGRLHQPRVSPRRPMMSGLLRAAVFQSSR